MEHVNVRKRDTSHVFWVRFRGFQESSAVNLQFCFQFKFNKLKISWYNAFDLSFRYSFYVRIQFLVFSPRELVYPVTVVESTQQVSFLAALARRNAICPRCSKRGIQTRLVLEKFQAATVFQSFANRTGTRRAYTCWRWIDSQRARRGSAGLARGASPARALGLARAPPAAPACTCAGTSRSRWSRRSERSRRRLTDGGAPRDRCAARTCRGRPPVRCLP